MKPDQNNHITGGRNSDEQIQRRAFLRKTSQAAGLAIGASGMQGWLSAAESPPGEATPASSAVKSENADRAPLVRIGILLGTFRRGTFEERLDNATSCGLDHVQVGLDSVAGLAMPDNIAPEITARIRLAAAEREMTIASAQGTFNMSHPDPEHRRTGLRRLKILAEACRPMGTRLIHVCSGSRDRRSMWWPHPENKTPEAWRDMTSCMGEAAKIAEDAGVALALEPEVNNVVDSAKKARQLMDEIASPALKITLDAANLFHTGELPRMTEILDEAFALLGKDIVLAHAKDLDHDGDAGHLAAGHGKLDYDHYVSLLHQYACPGPLLLHGLSEAQVPECVSFLREKIARIGDPHPAK